MPLNEQLQSQLQQQLHHHLSSTLRSSEILCNNQDKFLTDDGNESSAVVDLRPGRTLNSCKRYFTAPEPSGLFIRLIKIDDNMNSTKRNLSEFCPLSIVSIINGLDIADYFPYLFVSCVWQMKLKKTKRFHVCDMHDKFERAPFIWLCCSHTFLSSFKILIKKILT